MSSLNERPWGRFETLYQTERSWIKLLIVEPGHQTSLQSHRNREEVWVVVEGIAEVIIGKLTVKLLEGQYIKVGRDEKHRIRNPLQIPRLVIAEVALGHPNEEDITRYEDDYGRERAKLRAIPDSKAD